MSTTEHRADGWWIVGIPEVEDCGPYSVRADAESDRRGMERFLKYEGRKGFITTDTTTGRSKQ